MLVPGVEPLYPGATYEEAIIAIRVIGVMLLLTSCYCMYKAVSCWRKRRHTLASQATVPEGVQTPIQEKPGAIIFAFPGVTLEPPSVEGIEAPQKDAFYHPAFYRVGRRLDDNL